MEEERLYDLYLIDEYIKILKEFINYKDKSNSHFQLVAISHERLCESIEHLIEAYRKVKEENLKMRAGHKITEQMNSNLIEVLKDSVPKSKIKEKIEEILEKGKQMSDKERQEETQFMQGKLKALEELLEEE